MGKVFFFFNNLWYLFKSNFSLSRKLKILQKWFFVLIFWWLIHRFWYSLLKFWGYKIHWLNYSTLVWLFLEIFMRNEYKFNPSKNDPKILDLGANIGMATIYFKWLYPNSKIISFEPDKKHFQVLKDNTLDNDLSDVEYYEKAVTNYTGKITFYTDDKASFTMSTKKWRMSKIETVVDCISISEVIKKQAVDLLKMDIEWWELDVLKELDVSWNIKYIKEMIIEYHHNIKGDSMSFADFLDILEKNWFKYWLNTNLFPLEAKDKFQDIFVHAYRN